MLSRIKPVPDYVINLAAHRMINGRARAASRVWPVLLALTHAAAMLAGYFWGTL